MDAVTEPVTRRLETCLVHNNKHGFRGVEWRRDRQKYRARIEPTPGTRGKFLGTFDTAIEAARAYDVAAREVYGVDARLNFPNPGETPTIASRRGDGLCRCGHDLTKYGRPRADGRGVECKLCNNAASLRSYYRRRGQT